MIRRGSRSTLTGALTKGDRGRAVAVLTVISAAMALGGLLLTHVLVLTLVGLLLFIFGCMGLVQAIALALGIVDFHHKGRGRDRGRVQLRG